VTRDLKVGLGIAAGVAGLVIGFLILFRGLVPMVLSARISGSLPLAIAAGVAGALLLAALAALLWKWAARAARGETR
jgi:hypothetical protein